VGDELDLGGVGVLVLVDQDVAEPLGEEIAGVGSLLEEPEALPDQVVEVEGVRLAQPDLVLGEDPGHLLLPEGLCRLLVLDGGEKLVLGPGDHGADRLGRELPLPQLLVLEDRLEEAFLVGRIVDREAGIDPDRGPLQPQHPHPGGVERPHPQVGRLPPQEVGHPVPHLPGRLVREGEGENLAGRDPEAVDQVGDAVREDPGLPAPGPGQDEQGTVRSEHRLPLGRIQIVQELHSIPRFRQTTGRV